MYGTTTPGSKFTDDDKNAICNAYPSSGGSCSSSSECNGGLACVGGKCTLCKTASDCGTGATCEDGLCVQSCKDNSECKGGLVCRGSKCVSCLKDSECGSDRYCDQDVCTKKCKDAATDCRTEQLCMPDGRCIDPNTCATHDHCKADELCREGTCSSTADLGKSCQGQSNCRDGLICLSEENDPASFCTSWCLKQGSPCPQGFVCKAFDEERSFCAPKPPEDKEGGNSDGGNGDNQTNGGCNATTNGTQSPLLWMGFVALLLFFVGRIRIR